jgi:ABC-type branched-subunit amino acid transport system ATPase component
MSTAAVETAVEAQDRLVCEGVTVRFGGVVACNNVSLSVPPSSIVGLVGPNGAGKSTLFSVLSGLRRPNAGRVFLDGVDVTRMTAQKRARRGLARTFQHPEMFTELTVREHVVLSHRLSTKRSRVWTDMVTARGFLPPDKDEAEHIDLVIDGLGLGDVANRPVAGLSLGTTRLVELARALALAPKVLLLDEPSSGLDAQETEQVVNVFQRTVELANVSILIVEHDVDMVLRLCNYINVLDFGVTIGEGTPDEIRDNAAVRAAYLGDEGSVSPAAAEPPAADPEGASS